MDTRNGWAGPFLCAIGMLVAGPAAPTAAQEPGAVAVPAAERTIRVSGSGEARARPDLARLTFAVETFAETAAAAGRQNAEAMERVVAALAAAGVPRADIETQNYSVHPEYVRDPGPERPAAERIRGYRATNQVSLATPRLDRVGPWIDAALEAGANRVDGVAFELRDAGAVQAEALRDAVARARASAETMAAALGVRLGRVLDASTGVEPVRPMPMTMMRGAQMADAPPTPIAPGEQTVQAQVTLVFAIDGPA